MDIEDARKLREPFADSLIQQLPKAGLMLDYVSHATVTQRLLEVDPDWTWEPQSLVLDENRGLWITLTVCGVTKWGYGDAGNSRGGDGVKVAIGDAIRNAAMRFGVALDLWAQNDIKTTLRPLATDDQITDWVRQILESENQDDLKQIGDVIQHSQITDEQRSRLSDAWERRRGTF